MTKREQMATQILCTMLRQTMLQNAGFKVLAGQTGDQSARDYLTQHAVGFADALLAALDKDGGGA